MTRYIEAVAVLAIILGVVGAECPGQPVAIPDNQRRIALAFEQQGDNTNSEIAWRTFLKSHPTSAEAYAHLGLLGARQGRYTEAVTLYQKALAIDPDMQGLKFNLGLSLLKSGDLKQAIQTFQPLLNSEAEDPQRQRLIVLIGMAHYSLGEYSAAVPYLKNATIRDPQSLQLRLLLAHSCLGSKQFQCVLDVYQEILLLDAESAEADMLAGEALDEMKDPTGAVREFRAAVKADPRIPNVHFGLGYLLWKLGQYREAGTEFEAELANDVNNVLARAYLGDVKMRMQDPEAALPLLERVVSLDPGFEFAHLDLGILYSDAERRDDAIQQLTMAVKLNPNDATAHWRLARLYQSIGKKEESRAELEKVRSLHNIENETILNRLQESTGNTRATGQTANGPSLNN